jgi:hypothetical protein
VESIDFRPHIMFKNCRPVDQPELIPGMQLLLPLTPFDSRSCGSCRVHTKKKLDSPLWTLPKQKLSGSGYMWVQYTYDICIFSLIILSHGWWRTKEEKFEGRKAFKTTCSIYMIMLNMHERGR